jgi:hypothetical protein
MATPTLFRNQDRVWRKAVQTIMKTSGAGVAYPNGGCSISRVKRHIWCCAGTPSGAAPTGMSAGDLILDTTNGLTYRYISATTYVNATATS